MVLNKDVIYDISDDENYIRVDEFCIALKMLDYYMEVHQTFNFMYVMSVNCVLKDTVHEVNPIKYSLGKELNEKEPLDFGTWDDDTLYMKTYSYTEKGERTFRVEKVKAVYVRKDDEKALAVLKKASRKHARRCRERKSRT